MIIPDGLSGDDLSEFFLTKDVEDCMEEMIKIVEEFGTCVEDDSDRDTIMLNGHSLTISREDEPEEYTTDGEGVCGICGLCHWQIGERCTDTYGFSIDYLVMRESGMITCQSCMCDGVKCIECGVSQKLVRTIYDRDTEFIREEGTFPPIHRCHECQEQHEIYLNSARAGDNPVEESTIPPELQETYNGEFEIDTEGDETLLEDDEETKITKEMMKGVMDDMFGVTEEIPENTYMNIVNKMKEIYDRLLHCHHD